MSRDLASLIPLDEKAFFKRRTFQLVASIFVAQWAFFLALGLMGKDSPPPVPRLMVAKLASSDAGELAELADPGVFAGAHKRGFSGVLFAARRDDASLFEPKIIEPVFLSPFPEATAEKPLSFNRSSQGGAPFRAEPPLSQPLEGRTTEPAPTTFYFTGALKNRALVEKPSLGAQPYSDILSNSVIQLVVTAEGDVFSTRLLSSSGSRKVDLDALSLAGKIVFAPAPQPLQQGEWTIRWQTLPPTK